MVFRVLSQSQKKPLDNAVWDDKRGCWSIEIHNLDELMDFILHNKNSAIVKIDKDYGRTLLVNT